MMLMSERTILSPVLDGCEEKRKKEGGRSELTGKEGEEAASSRRLQHPPPSPSFD